MQKKRSNIFYTAYFSFLCVLFTEGRNFFVSKLSGRDEWPCDQSKPCETIWRAVNLASTGDYIYLNGKNTDKDPYTSSESTRLVFNGSDSGQEMNVTLSGLVLVESDVILQRIPLLTLVDARLKQASTVSSLK